MNNLKAGEKVFIVRNYSYITIGIVRHKFSNLFSLIGTTSPALFEDSFSNMRDAEIELIKRKRNEIKKAKEKINYLNKFIHKQKVDINQLKQPNKQSKNEVSKWTTDIYSEVNELIMASGS